MTFWFLQAMGDIDPDLVERAAQPPRKTHPLRWMAAVAAAAVMVVCVGMWWQHRPENQPIGRFNHSTENAGTSTTADKGTGGSRDCEVHTLWYHNFDGNLIEYVGIERFDTWVKATLSENTHAYPDCPYPDNNILACLEHFNIDREQFIEIMGWRDVLNHTFADSLLSLDEPSHYDYTFNDFVDAIYGDDEALRNKVFMR